MFLQKMKDFQEILESIFQFLLWDKRGNKAGGEPVNDIPVMVKMVGLTFIEEEYVLPPVKTLWVEFLSQF